MSIFVAVALAGAFAAVAQQAGELSAYEPGGPKPAGFDEADAPFVDGHGQAAFEDAIEREQARQSERADWLASSEAYAERESSATAFAGMSDEAAATVLEHTFHGDLEEGSAQPDLDDIADGRAVERFIDDHTVVLDSEDGRPPVLVESPEPLRAVDDDGHKRAVDLGLDSTSGGFEPRNAAAKVALPDELSDGVDVGAIGVIPGGAADGDLSASGDHVVYANASEDTDVVAKPVTSGVEMFWQLRSPAAPEELRLDLDLPDGASVQSSGGQGGGATVLRDGDPLATVSAPTAVDAQGQDVPVQMAVENGQLVLSIAHRDRDLSYPLLVDPVIEDWYGNGTQTWFHQNAAALSGLQYWSNTQAGVAPNVYAPRYDCAEELGLGCFKWDASLYNYNLSDGLHYYIRANTLYPAGSLAYWFYQPPGTTTRVANAQFGIKYARINSGAFRPYMFTGIWRPTYGDWAGLTTYSTELSNHWNNLTAGTYAGPQQVEFGYATLGNVTPSAWNQGYMGSAIIELMDVENPTVTSKGVSRLDGGDPTGWVNNATFAVAPTATDPGLGIKLFVFDGPGVSGTVSHTCTGAKSAPCPASWTLNSGNQFQFSTAAMPQGVNTVGIYAGDPIPGHTGSQTFQVKVDHTAPTAALTGVTNGALLGASNYTLGASGTDALSGMTSLKIKLDGQVKATNASCPTGQACNTSWTLNGADPTLGDGAHVIDVVSTDQAGNTYTKTTTVYADRTVPDINVAGGLDADQEWVGAVEQPLRMVITDDLDSDTPASGAHGVALYIDGVAQFQQPNSSCHDSTCVVDGISSVDLSSLAFGEHAVDVIATDQVGNTASRSWTVKIDNGAPTLSVSGDLYDGQPTMASAQEDLSIMVSDGDVITPESGPSTVAVTIDGREIDRQTTDTDPAECPLPACAIALGVTVDADQLTAGDHIVSVDALDSAANSASTSWTITVPSSLAGTPCPASAAVSTGSDVAPGDRVTVATAQDGLEQYAPAVIAPSEPGEAADQDVDPTLEDRPQTLASVGTLTPAEVSTPLQDGIAVGDPDAPVCITPLGMAANADPATVVNDDAALIANSQTSVDTIVRPTAAGVETLLQIRDSAAPQEFGLKMTLQPGQVLQQVAPDLVAIVDEVGPPAAPEATGNDEQPAPAPEGDTDIDDDWAAGPEADLPVEPTDPLDSSAQGQRDAVPDASAQLQRAAEVVDRAQDAIEDNVVGLVSAPWATDANGTSVPIELDTQDDVITVTVDHSGAAFPVVADPVYVNAQAVTNVPATAASHDYNDCPPGKSPCGSYDWRAAVKYARTYAVNFNRHYAIYGAGDCTNFVSQALESAGMNYMREWARGEGSWWAIKSRGIQLSADSTTHSWRLAETLRDHLLDYGLAQNTNSWHAGDLVWWNWGDGGSPVDHFHIVTKIKNGEPYLTGHGSHPGSSSNYADRPLSKVKQRVLAQHHPHYSFHRLHIVHTKANISH